MLHIIIIRGLLYHYFTYNNVLYRIQAIHFDDYIVIILYLKVLYTINLHLHIYIYYHIKMLLNLQNYQNLTLILL